MATRNVETIQGAHRAFNRRDFDAVTKLLSTEHVYKDRSRNQSIPGRQGFKDYLQSWVDSFSDARVADPVYIDAGKTVIAKFMARGTNDGPLGDTPATGRQIEVPFCELMQFDDKGMIISGEVYYDQLTMLTQLGLMKVPELAKAA